MGLPNARRYPVAKVARREEQFEIVFSGVDGAQTIQVPFRLLDASNDLEGVELRLLADLQKLGYTIRGDPPL
ncbi:MAG: hypothetical protein M3346_07425 [Actinomycetota bacterium]|nr:hypothetical protein [Actinomycetota bacterium]